MFYGPWRAAPSLVKLTDVLSRRGTPAYFLESHLPRGRRARWSRSWGRGCAPHPMLPARCFHSPGRTGTQSPMKVVSPCSPLIHYEGRRPARATGRAQRGRHPWGADQWSRGCRGLLEGVHNVLMAEEGAPVSQLPASICPPLPTPCHRPSTPPHPASGTLTTELQTEPLRASRSHQCHSLPCWNHFEIRP